MASDITLGSVMAAVESELLRHGIEGIGASHGSKGWTVSLGLCPTPRERENDLRSSYTASAPNLAAAMDDALIEVKAGRAAERKAEERRARKERAASLVDVTERDIYRRADRADLVRRERSGEPPTFTAGLATSAEEWIDGD